MEQFVGNEIIISPALITGYKQKRTHKKKRLNKKFLKRYGNEPIYDMEHVYYMDGKIFMSQGMFDNLKDAINSRR